MLEVKHLNKSFNKNKVLNDVSFTVHEGEIIGLLGSNGAGKSTLIKCINDLIIPDSGEILMEGKNPGVFSKEEISYLPEKSYLSPHWTCKKAVKIFEEFYPNFDRNKAEKLIQDFGMDLNAEIKTMSKGMQEKLQLALVMARKAKLYILDEPLGGVDPASRDKILDTVLTNFTEDASMIISTHLVSDIEKVLDRAIFLKDHEIFLDEEAESIREKENCSLDQFFRRSY